MKRSPRLPPSLPKDDGDPCPAFAARLSDLIEGACSPEEAEALWRHAGVCSACGRAVVLARALRRIVRELGRWEGPARREGQGEHEEWVGPVAAASPWAN